MDGCMDRWAMYKRTANRRNETLLSSLVIYTTFIHVPMGILVSCLSPIKWGSTVTWKVTRNERRGTTDERRATRDYEGSIILINNQRQRDTENQSYLSIILHNPSWRIMKDYEGLYEGLWRIMKDYEGLWKIMKDYEGFCEGLWRILFQIKT